MEAIANSIVEQYYNMDDLQRIFVLSVIEHNPEWNKYDYMKSLLLFNKMCELECGMGDVRLDDFIAYLDENSCKLNYWLRKVDTEYLDVRGYVI